VSKLRLRALLGLYLVSVVVAVFLGIVIASRRVVLIWSFIVVEAGCLAVGARIVRKLDKEMASWKRGESGEVIVGQNLESLLPDDFRVIHDLKTDYGNFDHVVIGPPGIFAVETKNWRGTVTADGNGELVWNERKYDKPHIANLTRRIMSVREQVVSLSKMDCFIQGVMVFPSAYLKADWGTTGTVHCIRGDQIQSYFTNQKSNRKLPARQIEKFSTAFLALARMDEGFEPERDRIAHSGKDNR